MQETLETDRPEEGRRCTEMMKTADCAAPTLSKGQRVHEDPFQIWKNEWKVLGYYGNTGCGVFKWGIQN